MPVPKPVSAVPVPSWFSDTSTSLFASSVSLFLASPRGNTRKRPPCLESHRVTSTCRCVRNELIDTHVPHTQRIPTTEPAQMSGEHAMPVVLQPGLTVGPSTSVSLLVRALPLEMNLIRNTFLSRGTLDALILPQSAACLGPRKQSTVQGAWLHIFPVQGQLTEPRNPRDVSRTMPETGETHPQGMYTIGSPHPY